MYKSIGITLTALILLYSSTSSAGFDIFGTSFQDILPEQGAWQCRPERGDDLNCVASAQDFLWHYVDQEGNTATIRLVSNNRVALTVNGMNNGTWPARLVGVSGYGCGQFNCWAEIRLTVNVNGEEIPMYIGEFYGLGVGTIVISVRGWDYVYNVSIPDDLP
ncbi:MAG: hypothetical protein V3V31_15030 [Methylococcales bacterium]